MNFIVKDLMISVLPKSFDLGEVAGCGACTGDSSGPPCSGICPGTRNPITAIREEIWLAENPVQLFLLKQQLQEQLMAVEQRTIAIAKKTQPLSTSDVSMLKDRLGAALQSLEASGAIANAKK
jgi:hypothetical protein